MNDNSNFFYTHEDEDRTWSLRRSYELGTPWDDVLRDYLDFLSAVYGYDIRSRVEIK